jgi:ubiquitin C-terminal hydrolase
MRLIQVSQPEILCDLDHATKNVGVYNLFGISHHSGSLYEGHYIR